MKKTLKKIVLFFLLACFAFSFTACGLDEGPKYTKDGKKQITFKAWGGLEEQEVFEKLVNEFNATKDDVVIVYDPLPTQDAYISSVAQRLQTGNGMPDIMMVPDGEYKNWVLFNNFLDITSYVKGEVDGIEAFNTEDIWESALPRFMFDKENKKFGQGSIHALPKDIGPTVIYYNKDIMTKAGVISPIQKFNEKGEKDPAGNEDPTIPMTWGELLESAESATSGSTVNDKIYGFYSLYWFAFNWSNGGDILLPADVYEKQAKVGTQEIPSNSIPTMEEIARRDKDTFAFDTELSSQALNFYASLFSGENKYFDDSTPLRMSANAPERLTPTKAVSPSRGTSNTQTTGNMFTSGKIAMMVEGRYEVPNYRKNASFDWDVAPLPVSPYAVARYRETNREATEKEARLAVSSGHSGSVGLAISKKTHFPKEAYEFISFIAGPKGQSSQAETGFNIPNQKSLANTDVFLQSDQKPANAQIFIHAAQTQKEADWTYTPNTKSWIHSKFFDFFNADVIYGDYKKFDDLVAQQKSSVQDAINSALKRVK